MNGNGMKNFPKHTELESLQLCQYFLLYSLQSGGPFSLLYLLLFFIKSPYRGNGWLDKTKKNLGFLDWTQSWSKVTSVLKQYDRNKTHSDLGIPWWPSGQDSWLSLPWPGFSPWSGNWDPASFGVQPKKKKKTKQNRKKHQPSKFHENFILLLQLWTASY